MALELVSGYHEVLWRHVLGGVKEEDAALIPSTTPQSQAQTGGLPTDSFAAVASKSALDILPLGVVQAVLTSVGSGNPSSELGLLLQIYGRCTCSTPPSKGNVHSACQASAKDDGDGPVVLSSVAHTPASHQLTAALVALRLLEVCTQGGSIESSHCRRADLVLQQLLLPLLTVPRHSADPAHASDDCDSTLEGSAGPTGSRDEGGNASAQCCGRCSSGLPPRSAAAQQVVEAITFLVSKFCAWDRALQDLLPLCIHSLSGSTQNQPAGPETHPDLTLVPALAADLLSSLLSCAVLHLASPSPHSTPPLCKQASHSDEFLLGAATSLLEAWLGYTQGTLEAPQENGVLGGRGAKEPLRPEFESAVLPALAQALVDCEER